MWRRVSGSSLVSDDLAQALDAVLGEGNAEPQIRERPKWGCASPIALHVANDGNRRFSR